jgi:hypothetical protein
VPTEELHALDVVAHWLPLHQDDLTIGPVLARKERVLARSSGGNGGSPPLLAEERAS